jgi:uncharacterized C2H2 Zn-finger protein
MICIPTDGAPYVSAEFKTKVKPLLVRVINNEKYVPFDEKMLIHPSFRNDNEYWEQVGVILDNKSKLDYILYANDAHHWCLNMGIIVNPNTRGGCPHIHGEVYILITIKELSKCNIDKHMLQTQEDYDKHMNGEDDKKFKRTS